MLLVPQAADALGTIKPAMTGVGTRMAGFGRNGRSRAGGKCLELLDSGSWSTVDIIIEAGRSEFYPHFCFFAATATASIA